MTLIFDLQLNLTLTNTSKHFVRLSSYCLKYEVFDLEMTLTLVLDLDIWPSTEHPLLVPLTTPYYPTLLSDTCMNHTPVPLILTTTTCFASIPLTTPCYPIPRRTTPFAGTLLPITLSQEAHPLSVLFINQTKPCYPHPHKNHTLWWYTLSFWPHPITTSLEEPHLLLVPFIILPYPRKNHTLWQYPSSPLPYPLPRLHKNHTL